MTNNGKSKNNTGRDRVEGAGHSAGSRGPWTHEEEEAISVLMELMPLLTEANETAKRRHYRRVGDSAGGEGGGETPEGGAGTEAKTG